MKQYKIPVLWTQSCLVPVEGKNLQDAFVKLQKEFKGPLDFAEGSLPSFDNTAKYTTETLTVEDIKLAAYENVAKLTSAEKKKYGIK